MNKPIRKSSHLATRRLLFAMVAIAAIAISAVIAKAHDGFGKSNAESILMITKYTSGTDGYWSNSVNQKTDTIAPSANAVLVAKNNGERMLVFSEPHALYSIKLKDQAYKIYKKNKNIPSFDMAMLPVLESDETKKLSGYHELLNGARRKYINDSIADAKVKAKQEKIRLDSLKRIAEAKEALLKDSLYRFDSDPHEVELSLDKNGYDNSRSLSCIDNDCNHYHSSRKINIENVKGDTIISTSVEEGVFDVPCKVYHAYVLPEEVKSNEAMVRHLKVWGDTLAFKCKGSVLNRISSLNKKEYSKFQQQIRSKAPYGFIYDWDWSFEHGPITFEIEFMNTSTKTIKYITFYFSVYNEVNDFRGSGYFTGTGPVEGFDTGSWDFDRSNYWPYGDTSRMRITKILITYMNGSKVTLTGPQIKYAEN